MYHAAEACSNNGSTNDVFSYCSDPCDAFSMLRTLHGALYEGTGQIHFANYKYSVPVHLFSAEQIQIRQFSDCQIQIQFVKCKFQTLNHSKDGLYRIHDGW